MLHPDFAVTGPLSSGFAHDLALLRLPVDAPLTPGRVELGMPVEVSELVRIVGFGRTRAGVSDEGTRREGEARVAALNDGTFELEGASQPCVFDSGGLVAAVDGGAQVGVVSSGAADCESGARITRLDVESTFLETYLAATSDSALDPGLDCPSPAERAPRARAGAGCGVAGERAGSARREPLLALALVFAAARSRGRRTQEGRS